MPQERYFQNPLSEHGVTHNHDLREGSMNEPAGGETRQEHEANIPKEPTAEVLRPSHVFGGEKNAPAPDAPAGSTGANLTGENLGQVVGTGTQEGLRQSGKASAGIGGLEGQNLKLKTE
ncbi:hypothetical protein MMYC01_202170 [Madurella mycetomatis]|uniref:Uncharacterized protein n=1 Tax=Madurella mycetomatis TaxID=100816 RepID=A0A175WBE9_9PEZI|nr:hypothetical protein MMYC01_202170 [Madurella mycetomatis]